MPNLNRVMLMGNLTRDPELRYLPSNTAVAGIGLAINRRWRNQQGEQQEETTFIDCEAFGRQAETINQYLRKGKPVFIEGRLKLDQWQDRDGNKRSKLKVVIERFEFIDSRESGGGGGQQQYGSGQQAPQQQQSQGYNQQGNVQNSAPGNAQNNAPSNAQNNAPQADPHQPIHEDDIPF